MFNKLNLSITTRFDPLTLSLFSFSLFSPSGLMICRNARHLSETMVYNKHRIKSLSDPSDYIQYFNALDGKGVVIEIQFSWWSFDAFKGEFVPFFPPPPPLFPIKGVIDIFPQVSVSKEANWISCFCAFLYSAGFHWVVASNYSWYIDWKHRSFVYFKAL